MMTRHFMDIRANLAEGQGGLIRILTDAERFGLSLRSVDLDTAVEDPTVLVLSATFLAGAGGVDAAQLAARFARHSGVMLVQCETRSAGPAMAARAAA